MSEVRFYHLRTQALAPALAGLLDKALAQGRKAVVRTANAAMTTQLDEQLWSYKPDSFLPHGRKGDDFSDRHPVWITDGVENPNGADLLILVGGAANDAGDAYALTCEVFDGQDDAALTAARARWKDYGAAGRKATYWQQGEKGWEQKA